MASSRAPGVILPTVPSMGSAAPTRATRGSSSKVVKIPAVASRTRGAVKPPRVKIPKMPKDASLLNVPKAKRVKNGREFSTKRKPII